MTTNQNNLQGKPEFTPSKKETPAEQIIQKAREIAFRKSIKYGTK